MRGSLIKRSSGSWSIVLDLEVEPDANGFVKRKQKWVTVRGTRKQAETRLGELLSAANGQLYVEPAKMTLLGWLREWLNGTIKPQSTPATYVRYRGLIENHIRHASIAHLLLQRIRPSHLETYYTQVAGSASTRCLHHTVLHRALRKAKRDGLVVVNAAADLEGKPTRDRGRASEDAQVNCWSAADAQAFLAAIQASGGSTGPRIPAEAPIASVQEAALYALALDAGARKGELCGLAWPEVDFEQGTVRISRQLRTGGPTPTFGPPKGKRPRTITISAPTLALLRAHKQHQRELKMRNRQHYQDHSLVFAKEWGELRTRKDYLGHPLQQNNLGERSLDRLIKAVGVKRITFHGLRHTSATLALLSHVAVHVVSQRLGHRDVQTTLNCYAHALPDAQRQAADQLAAVLYGR